MDFINKLIKKGIFAVVFCFLSFVLFGAEKIKAETITCDIKLTDGDKYLVLNTSSGWSDSGVTITCGEKNKIYENVSVTINDGEAMFSTESGKNKSDGSLKKAGFYKIKYTLDDDSITTDKPVSITRHVRVLPNELNSVRNIWLGDFEKNTASDDVFVRVVGHGNNYIAIGNFGVNSYVAYFNSLGEYLWHQSFENTVLSDIVSSEVDSSDDFYFIAGQNSNSKAFVKPIQLNDASNNNNATGINGSYGVSYEIASVTKLNKIIVSSSFVYASGYLVNENGSKTGKIVRLTPNEDTFVDSVTEYANPLESEYNSIIAYQIGEVHYIVAVGSTSVKGKPGATDGLVTVCDATITSCGEKGPYIFENSNGVSVTTTVFNDIVRVGEKYIVVGKSMVDRDSDDSLVLLLDDKFAISDIVLTGGSSDDEFYSIKEVASGKYIAVGKKSEQGVYCYISVSEGKLVLEEETISGARGNVAIKDVYIKGKNYVFVGNTGSAVGVVTVVEGMILNSKGSGGKDALLAIVDTAKFENFETINILQNAILCDGLTTCSADKLSYKLLYGGEEIDLSSSKDISSTELGTFSAYHSFENVHGVRFILGRYVLVSANPVAPDISIGEMGIDKWYLYSRVEADTSGSNWNNFERKPLMSGENRYYPVKNNQTKSSKVTYYKIDGNKFVVDTDGLTYTYFNYINLSEQDKSEDLVSNAAFQSKEKIEEFALNQEFARVAFVNTKYSYETTGITYFGGELASLITQNYYFVYYVDLSITNESGCGTRNGEIYGDCTAYTGYAFASLHRILDIAESIVKKYNYFVSESSMRYDPNGSIPVPSTEYFNEEMSTEKHVKNTTIALNAQGLYLEVKYYPLNTKKNGFKADYDVTFVANSATKKSVVFSKDKTADYKEDGKYEVRYCYNYIEDGVNENNCGKHATFILDNTAPVINYILGNETRGTLSLINSSSNPTYITGGSDVMRITNIVDIDAYAYTLVNGKKYYLRCNEKVNSSECISDLAAYVNKTYTYDKENPNKVYNIVVYDRAGNSLSTYFKLGTVKPSVSVVQNGQDSFDLNIQFFEKNEVDSFIVGYISSGTCTSFCSNASDIGDAVKEYLEKLVHNNNIEREMSKNDTEYTPQFVTETYKLSFSVSGTNGTEITSGGLSIPKYEDKVDPETGKYVLLENQYYILPLSNGLYTFALADKFSNLTTAYGGLGLGEANLYAYINADDSVVEESSRDVPVGKILRTELLEGENNDGVMLVKEPSTYEYMDVLPNSIENDFDEDMFFTQNFIYIKFEVNAFGYVTISKANTLTVGGSYGESLVENSNLDCLFRIYGSAINGDNLGTDCTNILVRNASQEEPNAPVADLSKYVEDLNDAGIYVLSYEANYFYLAFVNEGVYDVTSQIYSKMNNGFSGDVANWTAMPKDYSFTIDRTTPNISFELGCSRGSCKGEMSQVDFEKKNSDSGEINIGNIGNFDMKLKISDEYLDVVFDEEIEEMVPVKNGLMVVSINGEKHNAMTYASEKGDGTYISFVNSGTYIVTFYDASKNEKTYSFTIDNLAPDVDIKGGESNVYQQSAVAQISVNEASFLKNKNVENETGSLLVVTYWLIGDGGGEQKTNIIVESREDSTQCFAALDEDKYDCNVIDGQIYFSFEIPINFDKTRSGTVDLYVTAEDYFGNEIDENTEEIETRSFVFDNLSPYLYFTEEYTPIVNFGKDVSNTEKMHMLTTNADASKGIFDCDSGTLVAFETGQTGEKTNVIGCGDTPNIPNVRNLVKVYSYEAYRVAYNNYDYEGNPMENGDYLEATEVVYKKVYTAFASKVDLENYLSKGGTVYVKTIGYTQVTASEYIDPNIIYYTYSNGSYSSVSIQDMYTNSSAYTNCSQTSNSKCLLYGMYEEDGTFENSQDFYIKDEEIFVKETNVDSINGDDFKKYYSQSFVEDDGKYLPALTLANSCVKINTGACQEVKAGRIKLKSFKVDEEDETTVTYYNIINPKSDENASAVKKVTYKGSNVSAVIDSRIWQIAIDSMGDQVEFGFGLASEHGRPIIFVAKDGAGNVSSNYIETVVAIWDTDYPGIDEVSSVKYVEDANGNYKKITDYYKFYGLDKETCNANPSKYFVKIGENVYDSLDNDDCTKVNEKAVYYVQVERYVKVEDGTGQYSVERGELGDNYLTSNNLTVVFDEPIYRIECKYYFYDSSGEFDEVFCDFHNTTFDYKEGKTTFDLIYEPIDGLTDYYVNYELKVYDFSNKQMIVNSLFIDRQKPTIKFDDRVNKDSNEPIDDSINHSIAVDYSGSSNKSMYDDQYLTNGFINEIDAFDAINNRINSIGANINNDYEYIVVYYKYNYQVTYKNYVLNDNDGVLTKEDFGNVIEDGRPKEKSKTYYVLVKKPTGSDYYELKGNSGVCFEQNGEEYCYIEDDYNYYPGLVNNGDYWIPLDEGEYIENDAVGVYKIEYRVKDKVGNASNIIIKTVYINDRNSPDIKVNGLSTNKNYGYHTSSADSPVKLDFTNEKEAMVYGYQCTYGGKECSFPTKIFNESEEYSAVSIVNFPMKVTSASDISFDFQTVYKFFFQDKGYYIESINANGDTVMVLKYNFDEYTFLIDKETPDLYLNAHEDKNGNIYYEATLNKEEYLYCVSGDRHGGDPTFGGQNIPCIETSIFNGEERYADDYINMAVGYEYLADASTSYRLTISDGVHVLYKNNVAHRLTYNSNDKVYIGDSGTYVLKKEAGTYKLKIGSNDYVELSLIHYYKDTTKNKNVDYKLVINGVDKYTLYVSSVDLGNQTFALTAQNSYSAKDETNLITYYVKKLNNGKYQIRAINEKVVIKQRYNSSGEVIYEETYTKIDPNDTKYFYNKYYKKTGPTTFEAYALGAHYDDDNVYMITSIRLVFKNDGIYLIKAQDDAGNVAGVKTDYDSKDESYTKFIIDNTAPDYNSSMYTPTGVNYWYSVPSKVVTNENVNKITGVKDSGKEYYNIGDGLNDSFFYGFASYEDAYKYLVNIYNAHIDASAEVACQANNGLEGFNYTYYDSNLRGMVTTCFSGNGESNKQAAKNRMDSIIKTLIYPTFSGEIMFGDDGMKQLTNDKNMYRVVYLKVDSTGKEVSKSVVETCVEGQKIECIKVNAKISKLDDFTDKKVNLEISTNNAIDTESIIVYSSINSTPRSYDSDFKLSDVVGAYYIFEEVDKNISFDNFEEGKNEIVTLEHHNTTYYAIYVESNNKVEINYKENDVLYEYNVAGGTVTKNLKDDQGNFHGKYSLYIRGSMDQNFLNDYEIHIVKDENGNISEIYSYMILKIDGNVYNLNDYIHIDDDKKGYYIQIDFSSNTDTINTYTEVELMDRARNRTYVNVSLSNIAPAIMIDYQGEDKDLVATITIMDSDLTKTIVEGEDKVKIEFSTDRTNYSSALTNNILSSLLCTTGNGGIYGCNAGNSVNGRNVYKVTLENQEELYGFFKISLVDNHRNENSAEFVYNPANMYARYEENNGPEDAVGIRYINDSNNRKMVTNDDIKLVFNNKINYVILYRMNNEGDFVEVCNTDSLYTSSGRCGASEEGEVKIKVVDNQYSESILYYPEEGVYQARIINRASKVISNACFDGDVLKEDCKNLVSSSANSGSCSWVNNPEGCAQSLEVINREVFKDYNNTTFTKIEIDRAAPSINAEKSVVSTPLINNMTFISGENVEYINGEVKIVWDKEYTQLTYSCRYIDEDITDECYGSSTAFNSKINEYLFEINSRLSTQYTFWLEDYAGNKSETYTFSIIIALPEFDLYELDSNGIIMENNLVQNALIDPNTNLPTVNRNVQLVCRGDGNADCRAYRVVLEKFNGSGYTEVANSPITKVSLAEGYRETYRYTVYIKNSSTQDYYRNLGKEIVFTIDKQAPTITIEGDKNDLWGIYKGEVNVMTSDGEGVIYAGCVLEGVDELGNNVYACDEEALATFTSSYTLTETGTYMITAEDMFGNITKGRSIKFVTIDNDSPTISVKVKGQYLNYNIAENGFTNGEVVIVDVIDNSDGSYFMYRIKDENDVYGGWVTVNSNHLEITEEGFYEVVPFDVVGNQGREKHFIIYRQNAKQNEDFTVFVNGTMSKETFVDKEFYVNWSEPKYSYKAPIVKVTVNGKIYDKPLIGKDGKPTNADKVVMKNPGEYMFVFTDLAGNTTSYKMAINSGEDICLNNVGVDPKVMFLLNAKNITVDAKGKNSIIIELKDYKFSEDDVIILATPIKYFGGSSACGVNSLNYRMINDNSYIVVGSYAATANKNKEAPMYLGNDLVNQIIESGGSFYAIVVDMDTAKEDLQLPIGENFFSKDPIGWTLIFISGIGALYVAIRLIFFRKKVRVLK